MRAATTLCVAAVVVLLVVTSAAAAAAALEPMRVEAMTPGRNLEELRELVRGRRVPSNVCVNDGGVCPEAMARVWAGGSFMDELTPGGLAHGGLRLHLSLCCNFTFKADMLPAAARSVGATSLPGYLRAGSDSEDAATAAVAASASQRALYEQFVRTLLSGLPRSVAELGTRLFPVENAALHPSGGALLLVTAPLPYEVASVLVADLKEPRGHQGAIADDLPSNDDGLSTSNDPDGWFLKVGNFVLNCKCPRTMRARPHVFARADSTPTGFDIAGAGKRCLQSAQELTTTFELRFEVNDENGFVKPFASVHWTLYPASNPSDVHEGDSRLGVRVFNVPRNRLYHVKVTVTHGRVSASHSAVIGWGIQSTLQLPSNYLYIPELDKPREPAVMFGRRARVTFNASIDGTNIAEPSCARLGLADDGVGCVDAWKKVFLARVQCNVAVHHVPGGGVGDVEFTAPNSGENRLHCAISDEAGACPKAGTRLTYWAITAERSGDRQIVVCTENTSLTAKAAGGPQAFKQPPHDDISDLVSFGWTCADPKSSDAFAPTPALQKETIVTPVPESGLVCRFTVAATPLLLERHLLLPHSPTSDEITVQVASSYALIQHPDFQPINITTKTTTLTLAAPTPKGRWIGNSLVKFRDDLNPHGVVTSLPVKKELRTFVQWINSVPPCIGHEFFLPINVAWAPPVSTSLPAFMWYEDLCQQVQAQYPAPDEDGEFRIENETGSAPEGARLIVTAPNAVMLCDAPDGSIIRLGWRVFNPAGELSKTAILRRCSIIPAPTFARRMSNPVVVGSKLTVEANADFDTERFFGTWSASAPGVVFDDPHALLTVARGLPPGRTSIRFTLDAIGEQERPQGHCYTKSVLAHFTSEGAACPTGPLRTCSDSVQVNYYLVAPEAERRQSQQLPNVTFSVVCEDPAVVGIVDRETGVLRVTGLREGTKFTCAVTTRQVAPATPGEETAQVEADCYVTVERVKPVRDLQLHVRRFWVGNGTVNASVRATFEGPDLTTAAAGERLPRMLTKGTITRRTVYLSRTVADQTSFAIELLPLNPVRPVDGGDIVAAPIRQEAEASFTFNSVEDTETFLSVTLEDDLCPNPEASARLYTLQASVHEPLVITCDSMADLRGYGLPSTVTPEDLKQIKVEWNLVNVTRMDNDAAQVPAWVSPRDPYFTHAHRQYTDVVNLPYGVTFATFTVSLVEVPSARSSRLVEIRAVSRNMPPHDGSLFTTLSKFSAVVAPEATRLALSPAPGFKPARPPALARSSTNDVSVYYLHRGSYKLSYLPNPVRLPMARCPPQRHRVQTAWIQRLALRWLIGWERDYTECDLLRGEVAFVIHLLTAHPNGTFSRPPLGIGFDFDLSKDTSAAVLRELLSGAERNRLERFWWMSEHVSWSVSALDESEDLEHFARHNVSLGNATEVRGRANQFASARTYNTQNTTLYQSLRVTISVARNHAMSEAELDHGDFQKLTVPAAAVAGLAESVNRDLRSTTFVRVARLNFTHIEVLKGTPDRVINVTDEDVASGSVVVDLQVQRSWLEATHVFGLASNLTNVTSRPFSNFVNVAQSHHCNATLLNSLMSTDAHGREAFQRLGAWFRAAPVAMRYVSTACVSTNETSTVVRLRIAAESNFVIPQSQTVPLMVSKLALCGLPDPMPRLPLRPDQLDPTKVVDFGRMHIAKSPLGLAQSRDVVKQCVLAAQPWYIKGRAHGGYISADFLPAANATAAERHALVVRRADGRANEYDEASGDKSVAACIARLRPTVEFLNYKEVVVRIGSCPELQLGSGADSKVTLLMSTPVGVLVDGVANHGLQKMEARLTIQGSRAIVTPLLLRLPLFSVPTADSAAAVAASTEVEEITSPDDSANVRYITEGQLKSGRLVFRIKLEDDTWHPKVGLSASTAHNAAVAGGFGLIGDDFDPVIQQQRALSRQRWFADLIGLPGLVQYAELVLQPQHVIRRNETTIDIVVPPCEGANAAACRRVKFASHRSAIEEPVTYLVPGLATECPGCMRASPQIFVVPTLGQISVQAPEPTPTSSTVSAVAKHILRTQWNLLAPRSALVELPEFLAVDSHTHLWRSNVAGLVRASVVTQDNEVRAVYTATTSKPDRHRVVLQLDPEATAAAIASSLPLVASSETPTTPASAAPAVKNATSSNDLVTTDNVRPTEALLLSVTVARGAFDLFGGIDSIGDNDARIAKAHVDTAATALANSMPADAVSPIRCEIPFALAAPAPPSRVWFRVFAAACHGYLAFFASEGARLLLGWSSRQLQHHGPTSGVARAVGVLVFGLMIVVPTRSPVSGVVFGIGWWLCLYSRGISWLAAELLLCHAAVLYLAP
jgi:hypothetical protein